jgi:hypothetical protein
VGSHAIGLPGRWGVVAWRCLLLWLPQVGRVCVEGGGDSVVLQGRREDEKLEAMPLGCLGFGLGVHVLELREMRPPAWVRHSREG